MGMDILGHTEVISNVKRRVKVEESGVVRIRQIKTTLSIGATAGVDREWDKASGGCIDSTEEPLLSSSEEKHWEDDTAGAIPYSDSSHEQKRAGSADGGIAGPLDEAEECLTVDRS